MSRFSMILLVASLTVVPALVVDRSNAAMRPDVVAKTLEKLQKTWAAQAYAFTGCATTGADFNCKEAPKAFAESCGKISIFPIKEASKDNVVEYVSNICTHMPLGWHQVSCQKAGTLIAGEMSESDYENRKSAKERAEKACHGLWLYSVAEQEAKAKQEKAKEEEDAKKESAQEEKEEKEEKEAKNAKPVSFLQEGLSEAEARRQQEGVSEVLRHQAEMLAQLPEVSDELTHVSPMSLFQNQHSDESSEHTAVRVMTEEELHARAAARVAKYDADQKKMADWAAGQSVKIQSRNAMIDRIQAARKRSLDSGVFPMQDLR